MFDTNIFLALIFPLDTWKPIVEEPLDEALELVRKGRVKIVCPDKVYQEIDRKITSYSDEINKEFNIIYNEIKNLKGNFTKDNVLHFRKIMEHRIFEEKKHYRRNRLYFIESLILKEIKENNQQSVINVLHNTMEFFNEITTRFTGEFTNYIRRYEIERLVLPKNENVADEIDEIKSEVEKSVKNKSDAIILSVFIYFLKEEKKKGIFVTHDFHDLLLNSIALEAIFPDVLIIRPGYVKCLL